MRLTVIIPTLMIGWASTAVAQNLNWAQKMFDKQSHDFGVVARGADVRHRFKVKNIYKETIHISNVRTTCGCSSAKISKNSFVTYEEGYLEVSIDTQRFSRKKSSSVVVVFDSPQPIEVTLPLEVYIRTDVVLTPGAARFGILDEGVGGERKVEIAYAGRDDWAIEKVKTNNKYLSTRVVQKQRGGGRIKYDLFVSLKPDAPVGSLRDRLTVITNDSKNPYVPILVTGRVEADVTVTPSPLSFGRIKPGDSKTMNVVLKGKKPFIIDKIECESNKQAFRFRPTQGEKRVHVVPLTLTPPNEPGRFTELFTVTIAGRKDPMTFKASAEIMPVTN